MLSKTSAVSSAANSVMFAVVMTAAAIVAAAIVAAAMLVTVAVAVIAVVDANELAACRLAEEVNLGDEFVR